MKFLKDIYGSLDGNIEVREISVDKQKKKRRFFKSIEEMLKYTPPEDMNVFMGMYSRLGKNGSATGCMTTKCIWGDYDYKTLEEVKEQIKIAGLPEASYYINSGHGIHVYWLLDKRYGEEAINVIKAIQMKTCGDSKVAEKARIMRFPGSYNLKKGNKRKCEIIQESNSKYKLNDFKKILQTEIEHLNRTRSKATGEIKELKGCSKACLRNMAKGTVEGHRNFALCKITKWLQLKGYTRRAALDIVQRWNTLNQPPQEEKRVLVEFNKVWDTEYKFLGCAFKNNAALQEQSDYFCSKGECRYSTLHDPIEITNEKVNKIDNLVFQGNTYSKLSGLTLAIYFTISKTEGITRTELSKLVGKHTKTKKFLDSIKVLEELELIRIITGNKREKEKELLIKSNKFNDSRGYTIVNNLLSETFLGKRIKDNEYKLLVLLQSYSFSDTTIYPTVKLLTEKMGISDRSVTQMLKDLERKLYLKRSYITQENGKTKLLLKLLF